MHKQRKITGNVIQCSWLYERDFNRKQVNLYQERVCNATFLVVENGSTGDLKKAANPISN